MVFRLTNDLYCSCPKPQVGSNRPKSLLVRYSAHVMAHDITSHTDISCIIEPHIGGDLAEKPHPTPRIREKIFRLNLSHWTPGRKAPPPKDEGNFWTLDLSISGHFQQLWFLWQKSTPPPRMREFFLTLDLSISGNFQQLWFLWQKSPPPSLMRENFLTLDLSIAGHFQQLWCLWQKRPPPPLPRMRANFLTLDLSISGNFQQLWIFVAENPPPPMGEIFLTLDLFISGNFQQLWFFYGKKAPPPPSKTGKCLCARITTRDERPLAGYDNLFITNIYN